MSRSPLFSILLPTHNQCDLLRYSLESVCAQSLKDFELLVIGDGCTDDTEGVVAQFISEDKRVSWHPFEKGFGVGYENRNKVLRGAQGRLIAYMAHDDLWMPDHLEQMRVLFDRPGVEWAYSRPVFVERDGEVVPMAFNLFDPEILEGFMGKTNCSIYLCSVVHTKQCFEKYGWWDGTIERGGDLELWIRIIEGGKRINYDYLPVPTTLRFRAPYKTDQSGNPWEMQVWQKLTENFSRAKDNNWAQMYKIDISPGSVEQKSIWQQIKNSSSEWTYDFRRQIACQLDNRIWRANHFPFDLIPNHKQLGIDYNRIKKENAEFKEKLSE